MGKYAETEKQLLQDRPQSIHEFFTDQLRRKFMTLPGEHKQLIREAHKDGIEWHGEDTHHKMPQLDNLTHFEHVIREFGRMKNEGFSEHKEKALARLHCVKKGSMGGNV